MAGAIATLAEAAAITPEFAQNLYGRVAPLHEADGCRLTRFDTSRVQITIGLESATHDEQFFDLGALPGPTGGSRTVGEWWVAVSEALARDCPTTVAAIERILGETSAPTRGWRMGGPLLGGPSQYDLLAVTFFLLLLGTVYVLYREVAVRGAPARLVVALLLVSVVGLALRLTLSPHTFLHEYYHIAETVPAYFSNETVPGYGKTGPALFRVVAWMVEGGDDERIIFLTNAVISSLAIPAAAMLVLAVFGSWPQAVCAALLLAVLPQHLRFSGAEDLFVQAITFGLWSLALFASHQRTHRWTDALLGVLAATLATQARPDMIFFPLVVAAFLLCNEPRAWRRLFTWPMLVAGALFVGLLLPHVLEVLSVMGDGRSPSPHVPSLQRYVETLILFDSQITPVVYWVLIVAGAAWWAIHRPGWLLWIVAVYLGFTIFTLSIFDNPPWRLRAQNLPMSFLVLLGAGAVPMWMAAWRSHRQRGAVVGSVLLALMAVGVVAGWRGFVAELKDQQLEWAFLERHVSQLPAEGTLLTAVDAGGRNLDAFPEFLLARTNRRYELVDVRNAANGSVTWPKPKSGALLFYQGMFCYFAFTDEPAPDPMTSVCRAVHERYEAEPLMVEDLDTEGYSALRYAQGGRGVYRIGFYRLTPRM
ncbi:MAG: hypothetical protein ABI080_00190 [Candidatus Binatia bacterium]